MKIIKKKFYILERKDLKGPRYDVAQGFVICATSSKQARTIASKNAGDEGSKVWLSSIRSSCRELNAQKEEIEIIMKDFCAG
jgi:hypothetical protein